MKLTAVILSLAIVMALAIPAFADENDVAGEVSASTGIINADELQQMMDDFVAKYSLDTRNRSLCVGFCYLKTGDMWFYNEGKWCYSASLYKVPVSMLLAEREVAGEISADTVYENKYYTGSLETLEQKAIVNSNNDAGHALADWMGGTYNGKCADQLIKFTDLPESYFNDDFFSVSYYNVNFYTQILRTLYNNQENYPRIIDYMKQAQPNAYLRTYLEGKYEVAQKYGAFEETKVTPTKNNNHAGGIIFTPNPIAVTVMTVNVDNFNDRIGEIAQMLADYALVLDTRYEAYEAEQARAAQEEAERLAREEQERLAAEAAASQQAAVSTPAPTVNPDQSVFVEQPEATETPAAEKEKKSFGEVIGNFLSNTDSTQRIIIIAGLGIFIIGLALLIVALNMRHRRRYDDDYEEEYEDEDFDDEEMLEPPALKRRERKMTERESEYYDEVPQNNDQEEYYDINDYAQPETEKYLDEEEAPYEQEEEPVADGQQDYLDESEDFLDSDTVLDQSDLEDFKSDFLFDEYSAYNDTDYTPEDPDPSAGGNHYAPRH